MPETSVDGITGQPATPPPAAPKPPVDPKNAAVKRTKTLLLTVVGVVYGLYLLWLVMLLSVLPDPTGALQGLAGIGMASALIGLCVFAGVGLLFFMHIQNPDLPLGVKRQAMVRLALVTIPGVVISILAAVMLTREPGLALDIVNPTKAADFVAPLAITFSVERAVATSQNLGMNPIQYRWDLNGDNKVDQETTVPTITATFEKDGVYGVQVQLIMSDGRIRVASRRLILSKAVFAMTPPVAVVERPVTFSISNLVANKQLIKQIDWDFDGDGKIDVTTKDTEVKQTFYALGPITVTVSVQLTNNAKQTYSRTVTVEAPPPLPFPVELVTEPKRLISTPPFGVKFAIKTDTPVVDTEWSFGEGESVHANSATHTYEKKGKFPVVAKVRSASGQIAELSALIRVVDELQLPDLAYDGAPLPANGQIVGEAPLTVQLTPKTGQPFVRFTWEAPNATEVGSTSGPLQAIYREVGTYTLTLIAEDTQDHVKVIPIIVTVKPPTSSLVIRMDPEGGVAPLKVRFDASESYVPGDAISGFVWAFGDRTDEVFGPAQVEHTFQTPGTYTIDLRVRTTGKQEVRTSRAIVVRESLLKACIQASRLTGPAPLGIQFDSSCSAGTIISALWDFGDGSQSDQRSVVHSFAEPGTYVVTFKVTSPDGRTSVDSVSVTVTAP
ncbi:MAG: PKD domain-containing protein [Candidatus Peribacteraceae bacterium]|nr:PKD domain-containing protein [Candidatus Peribacteraceae bacterium]